MTPPGPPSTTLHLAYHPAGGVAYLPDGVEGPPALSSIIGSAGFRAYGWDALRGIFDVRLGAFDRSLGIFNPRNLGTFPSLDAALEALNAHGPTARKFGRLILPPPYGGPMTLPGPMSPSNVLVALEAFEAPTLRGAESGAITIAGRLKGVPDGGWGYARVHVRLPPDTTFHVTVGPPPGVRGPTFAAYGDGFDAALQAALVPAREAFDALAAYFASEAPEKTTTLRKTATGTGLEAYTPDGARGPSAITANLGSPGYRAYGWHYRLDSFDTRLGEFPSVQEAVDALNAHPPTVAKFGRIVLAAL